MGCASSRMTSSLLVYIDIIHDIYRSGSKKRKKKMKKLTLICCLLVAVSLLLISCDSKDEDPETPQKTPVATEIEITPVPSDTQLPEPTETVKPAETTEIQKGEDPPVDEPESTPETTDHPRWYTRPIAEFPSIQRACGVSVNGRYSSSSPNSRISMRTRAIPC